MSLIAPFPYYGGKRRAAADIWERFGDPTVYVEPFFGSGAVLLHRDDPCSREIACDIDGHVVNFWRAVRGAPDEVAYWADYPTYHHDLTARHRWLVATQPERDPHLRNDPDWFDAKAAGWWVWGISSWVGSGWCRSDLWEQRPDAKGSGQGVQVQRKNLPSVQDQRPHSKNHAGGQGVQVQAEPWDQIPNPTSQGVKVNRKNLPEVWDQRPSVEHKGGGRGVQAQAVHDKRPLANDRGGGRGVQVQRIEVHDKVPQTAIKPGGRGVNAQRTQLPDKRPHSKDHPDGSGVHVQRLDAAPELSNAGAIGSGERLIPWFQALAQRLAGLIILDRDWQSALTPTLLMDTPTSPDVDAAIFLDPPYELGERNDHLYDSDRSGESPATAAWEWAVEHGERYRIAYAAHEGDFELPDGWSQTTYRMSGRKRDAKNEAVYFSPACLDPNQTRAEQGVLL